MTARVQVISTHLPRWGDAKARVAGIDEDAVTLAVAAGTAALAAAAGPGGPGAPAVEQVVFVTRDQPLQEGGSTAVLLAALDLPAGTRITQVLGGAPAALDAITGAAPGTLVLAADLHPAGAGAALIGGDADSGDATVVRALGRSDRSVPVHVRDDTGHVFEYSDARLVKERGVLAGLATLDLPGKPLAVAGLSHKDAGSLTAGPAPALPTTGASSVLFALAALVQGRDAGPLLAVEQATVVAAAVEPATTVVRATAPAPAPLPKRKVSSESDIKISLAAYDRAFDAKVRLRAGKCGHCGTLALPPRTRCLGCGSQDATDLVALPRTATVYTTVTVNVPVPGLATPYSLAVVELGDSGVRLLTHVTDAEPGSVGIEAPGTVVLRRLALRAGVPDYGYAFAPAGAGADGTEGQS